MRNTGMWMSFQENSVYTSVSQTVGNRDVTGGARQTGGNFPFYALYGNVRSNLPESGARPRTRLESDCAVCVRVCVQHVISVSFLYSWLQMKCLTF